MYRVRGFIIFLISMSAAVKGLSQRYFTPLEIGISAGGTQYFGDLNQHYGFKSVNVAGGVYARQRLNSYIAAKLVANYTSVGYDDKFNSEPYAKLRNLNFKSDIIELVAQAEFNFFAFITGDELHRFTPYLTGGIGVFYYDPYTTYNGQKQYLRPLGTEGQFAGYSDRKYTNISPCFPIGAGVKFWIKGGVNLTFEISDRLTMTDYMDDVSATYVGAAKFSKNPVAGALQDRSVEAAPGTQLGKTGKQRGNTSSYDQYLMAMLSISFNFTSYRCPHSGNDDELRVR